ncbi:hypothetical protein AB1Y20_014764 [Prymnesium parvum]|uniref:GYF domain-containing protein n=1 Tax=Prymnesium parvum TaxID=97485 RepID=A0AB34IF06_PRYPA
MATWFFVGADKQKYRFREDELPQLVRDETVGRDTLVWAKGRPDWVPLHAVAELMAHLPHASGGDPSPAPSPASERAEAASAGAPARPAAAEWFLLSADKQRRRVSGEELRQLVLRAEVGAATLVWRRGRSDWTALGAVEELEPLLEERAAVEAEAAAAARRSTRASGACAEEWFYVGRSKQRLRATREELAQLAMEGEVTGETLVWAKGRAEWSLLREVRGLAEVAAHAGGGGAAEARERQEAQRRKAAARHQRGGAAAAAAPAHRETALEMEQAAYPAVGLLAQMMRAGAPSGAAEARRRHPAAAAGGGGAALSAFPPPPAAAGKPSAAPANDCSAPAASAATPPTDPSPCPPSAAPSASASPPSESVAPPPAAGEEAAEEQQQQQQEEEEVARVEEWKFNEDGSLEGRVYGKRGYHDGDRITTSFVPPHSRHEAYVVTGSGTKYLLGKPAAAESGRASEADGADGAFPAKYAAAHCQIMESLAAGVTPPTELYAERDLQLFKLSDALIKRAYREYADLYLGESTPPRVRGMAEMTLIRLGEVVDMPRHKRIKMAERGEEEAKSTGVAYGYYYDDDDEDGVYRYQAACLQVMETLEQGDTPTVEQYAQLDLALFQLSDSHLAQEKANFVKLYLEPDATPQLRKMVEMTLIKLSKLTALPRHERVKMAEAQHAAAQAARRDVASGKISLSTASPHDGTSGVASEADAKATLLKELMRGGLAQLGDSKVVEGMLRSAGIDAEAESRELNLSGMLLDNRASAVAAACAMIGSGVPTVLDLSENDLNVNDAKTLAPAIAASRSLTRVDLHRNNLAAAGVAALVSGGALASALVAVDLAETDMGAEGARAIAAALRGGSAVRSLDVGYNFIDQPAALELLAAMKGKGMVSVGVAGCELGPDGARALAGLASGSATLKSVNAMSNGFDSQSVALLLKIKDLQPSLTTLCGLPPGKKEASFVRRGLKAEDIQLLAPEVAAGSLSSVDVSYNSLDRAAALELLAAMKGKEITTVGMAGCELGPEGALSFAQFVSATPSVRSVNLASNELGVEGAVPLAKAFAEAASLKYISLANNGLGDEGVMALVEHGLFRCRLMSWDLKSNRIGFEGANALAGSGAFTHHLEEADLRTNPLTAPGRQKLRQSVETRDGVLLRL